MSRVGLRRHLVIEAWERMGRPMLRKPIPQKPTAIYETEDAAWDNAPAMCFNNHGGITTTHRLGSHVVGYRYPLSILGDLPTEEIPDTRAAEDWVDKNVTFNFWPTTPPSSSPPKP
jgi:hypothetical protein